MEQRRYQPRLLPDNPAILLKRVRVKILTNRKHIKRCLRLLDKHHYLKGLKTVGLRLFYAIVDEDGECLGVAVFTAAARAIFTKGTTARNASLSESCNETPAAVSRPINSNPPWRWCRRKPSRASPGLTKSFAR